MFFSAPRMNWSETIREFEEEFETCLRKNPNADKTMIASMAEMQMKISGHIPQDMTINAIYEEQKVFLIKQAEASAKTMNDGKNKNKNKGKNQQMGASSSSSGRVVKKPRLPTPEQNIFNLFNMDTKNLKLNQALARVDTMIAEQQKSASSDEQAMETIAAKDVEQPMELSVVKGDEQVEMDDPPPVLTSFS